MDSPFHSFCQLIRSLDPNDDSIVVDRNLKYLAGDINDVLEGDENILWSALQYFNERPIEDNNFAVNFALLFTSSHFDGLREHLQSSDGNSMFRVQILNMQKNMQQNYLNADKLKLQSLAHFYNSITLLGEFYNRLHQKSQPVLVLGRSLFELLAKELKNESVKCTNDPTHVFNMQFARLLLTQVTLNGSLAKAHHSNEIEALFYELRKCLIEVPHLASATKAFLLMTLDLYYSGFKSVGPNLEKFYSKFLDEYDGIFNRPPSSIGTKKEIKSDEPPNSTYNLRHLKKDFAGLKTNGGPEEHRKINREYLNRPLKASDLLKYFQNSNSEIAKDAKRNERNNEILDLPQNQALKESNSDICLNQTNSLNNNQTECNDHQSTSASTTPTPTNRPALLTISTNCQDATKIESAASPTESHESAQQSIIHPKLENFNWFEAVEREEIPNFTPNLNNSGDSNKFDTLSVASYSSNPASPQDRRSPQTSHPNRSRRNSLNRFRSDIYRQSTEDLHQNEKQRPNRNDGKQSQNYHHSWRNAGRNSPRNGYNNKRGGGGGGGVGGGSGGGSSGIGDYDRENSNNNGRHNDGGGGGNYNRRNLLRGGSVDGNQPRTRHDSFNRRNQENDNFEHFQSYNRKTYSRNKDDFNRTLPPRLQNKWQQQQQRSDYNDCDNPKRNYNNRNNQSGNTTAKATPTQQQQ